jgi:hypothetical protein
MDLQVVEIVLARARGYCEVCGLPAQDSMAFHHRKLKSREPRKEFRDVPSNLIWVHHECHNLGTNSIHFRVAYATAKGWIVPSWAKPEEYPCLRPDGVFAYLEIDGSITLLPKQEGA